MMRSLTERLAITLVVTVIIAILVYLMCRGVQLAKKANGGAYMLGTILMVFGFGAPTAPAREVTTETRRLKREDNDSGDTPTPSGNEDVDEY